MSAENTEPNRSAQQHWEDLPQQWKDSIERLRALCEANGFPLEDLDPPPINVRHLDLLPLLPYMSQHRGLQQLYPFTSHAYLRLSDTPASQAIMGNYPLIEALSDGHFRVLEERGTPQNGTWEFHPLFVGTAQQAADYVAEQIRRRLQC